MDGCQLFLQARQLRSEAIRNQKIDKVDNRGCGSEIDGFKQMLTKKKFPLVFATISAWRKAYTEFMPMLQLDQP